MGQEEGGFESKGAKISKLLSPESIDKIKGKHHIFYLQSLHLALL